MARRISVEITGDASSLERSFKRAGHASSSFNRDLSKGFRGAAAGSGIFRSLGRSLAFASGGFLAFATAGEAIRKSIDAATEQAATQRQLAAQFRATGTNLSTYKGQIEDTTLSVSKLSGFQDDDLLQSFITAYRGSKSVTVGLKIQAIAADVARGRHIGLAQSTLALTKAYGGQSTALRRLGVLVPKNLSGMKALNFVQRAFAGQALAGTTAQQRFGAALHNTEETIGGALLPSLNKYLNRATAWLDQSKNQQKIQREVNSVVKTGTAIIQGFADAARVVSGPLKQVTKALGGTREAVKLLLEGFAAFKLTKLVLGEEALGSTAVKSAGEVDLLRSSLLRVAGPWVATLYVLRKDIKDPGSITDRAKGLFGVIQAGGRIEQGLETLPTVGPLVGAIHGAFPQRPKQKPPLEGPLGQTNDPFAHQRQLAAARTGTGAFKPGPAGFKARFADQELKLAQAQLTASQADDRKVLFAEAQLIRERIKRIHGSRKHLGEETQLTQQLAQIQGQLTTVDQQSLQSTLKFRKLELALAQAQLTQTQSDDKKALVAEASLIRARLATMAKTNKTLDARTQLTQQLAGIEGQIQSIDKEALDKRKAAAAKHLQAIKQKEQELRQRISQITSQFSQALDAARSGLGELFQGPVLAPTEAQAKAKLGFKGPDVKTLTQDLNAQVAQFQRFQHDLALLAKRGAPKQLLKELRAKGTEALPEIEALAKAKPADLKAFFKAFGKGEKLVQTIARADMKAQLVVLRADKLQLQQLRGREAKSHAGKAKRMAQGAIVRSHTFAELGESGPEAVVPLARGLKLASPGPISDGATLRRIAGLLSQILATLKGQQVKTNPVPGSFALSHVLQERVRVSAISREIQARTSQASVHLPLLASAPRVVMPRQQLPRAADAMRISARPERSDNRPILNVIEIDGQRFARVMTNRQKRNTELGVSQVRGRHGGRNAMGPV